jgi:probable phosphoglycerate mutase
MAEGDISFYIVRHGQTVANATGVVSGQVDTPLTPNGIEQAQQLGRRLKKYSHEFSNIFSSDLGRAYRTAHIIAEEMCYPKRSNFDVVAYPELREMSYGKYNCHPYVEICGLPMNDPYYQFPGGESFREFQSRIVKFIHGLCPGFTYLLVTHSRVIKAVNDHWCQYQFGVKRRLGHDYIGRYIVNPSERLPKFYDEP